MILKVSKRKKTAYYTAFRIGFSYLFLSFFKRFYRVGSFEEKLSKLHSKNALLLKEKIIDLNGLFIKIGQLISVMSSVLPKAYGEAMESLQDKAPVSNFERVKPVLTAALNESIDNVFKTFDETPIASASIGQVHKATLFSGETVAVKVQHPYISTIANLDLDIIENLFKMMNRFFTFNGLDTVYTQVKIMILEELDYQHEADSMVIIKQNIADIEGVKVPKVFTAYSTKNVLVTEFCAGVKITDAEKIGAFNMDEICDKLLFTYCEMMLKNGFYHADPHPGNLLLNENGEIVILDFGAVGTLSKATRFEIPKLLQAVLANDEEKVLISMQKLGFLSRDNNKERVAAKIIAALQSFINSGVKMEDMDYQTIKNSEMEDLRKELSLKELTATFDVPKDWILLERTILLLLGVCNTIHPNYNPIDTVKPYLKNMILSKEYLGDFIKEGIKNQANIIFSLPSRLDTVLRKANKGEIEFEIKSLPKSAQKLYLVIQQFIFGLFGILAFVMAYNSNENGNKAYEKWFLVIAMVSLLLFIYVLFKGRTNR
ncbi:hypothetical protein DNU06_11825 [Putridiphycobacter roseus]|uniref:ABC1 atypical kinase-like domain-containing protein n=1 Tax=Putridiphycobacter roseus TaxID=2219161 RepID=A0A2W1NPJ1_9FLAO|nr:AarF/UbiB family protein [Putridiphycobacter roseus]PZE16538.1 hypothetical protein DNU06_11825 [Putridiphycobacter roseus]